MGLYLEQMKSHAGLDKDAYKESNVPKDVNKFKEYITDRIITKLLSVHLFQREDYRDVENPEETLSFFSKKATIEDVQDLLASLGKVTTQLLDKYSVLQSFAQGNLVVISLCDFSEFRIILQTDFYKLCVAPAYNPVCLSTVYEGKIIEPLEQGICFFRILPVSFSPLRK